MSACSLISALFSLANKKAARITRTALEMRKVNS